MDNIDKFISELSYNIGDIEEYLEIANYIIIDVENSNKEKINEQIMEYLTADSLKEICRWGITPGTKYLLIDVRFGFDRCLFNSYDVDVAIYEILYDYIEEELEKHYYNTLPFEENTPSKRRELVEKAITKLSYEAFEPIAENLF